MLASVCAFAMVKTFGPDRLLVEYRDNKPARRRPAEEQAKSESHEGRGAAACSPRTRVSKAMDAVQELYTQDHTWGDV